MSLRVLALLLSSAAASAATPPWLDGSLPLSPPQSPLSLPALDTNKALLEDFRETKLGQPRRIGLVAEVEGLRLGEGKLDAGRWSILADGRYAWRVAIDAPGALALDFEFKRFRLPAGAELWLRSGDGKDWLGPYTDADNRIDGKLYTALLTGSSAVLELTVPQAKRDFVELQIGSVNRAYRGILPDPAEINAAVKSGSCNIDVACPDGDAWRSQINSVAHYTFRSGASSFVCTGQLSATTQPSNDITQPTFLTAHHCVSSQDEVGSMVFYWRYESPTCRAPNSASSGQPLSRASNTAAQQSGATLLATHQPTDFTVVRLSAAVPAAANAYWTGWDRSEASPTGSVAIHHPAGHEKRISFNDQVLAVTNSCIASGTANNTHWRVDNWERGTTEGGSSGSGLWRPDSKRLIGVLSGGAASCSVIDFDCFGRLATAWQGGGTAASRVSDWLDPTGSGVTTLDGHAAAAPLTVSLNSAAFTTPPNAGAEFELSIQASAGNGSYTYDWDTDGDGVFERSGSSSTLRLSYPKAQSTQVRVRVRDSAGAIGTATRALDVRGAQISAQANGAPVQVCGNNNSSIDPGEVWQQPVRLSNSGAAGLGAGAALFTASGAGSGQLELGPNNFGYRGTRNGDACGFSFIDIAGGANAVSPLSLTDPDDGRASQAINLGGSGIAIYGQRFTQAVMSTNGYVSFALSDGGGDFSNDCSGGFGNGSAGPQLRPLHDDLVVGTGGGLRYRYFASCPRAAESGAGQGCHVFQWTGMGTFSEGGNFEFQAVAYENSGQLVYQYRSADPQQGGAATIGLVDAAGADPFNAACNTANAAPAASAVCIYTPDGQPAGGASLSLTESVHTTAAIAAGGSTTVNVPFKVADTASCGAALGVDFLAAADNATHWFNRSTVLSGTVAASCQPVTTCNAQNLDITVPPRRGLYFNQARPGNGMNGYFYDIGNNQQIFGGLWYTANADRNSVWYLVQGEVAYYGGEMPLVQVSNAAAPSGFNPISTTVGRAWVGQVDNDSLLLAWQFDDGRSGAERMDTVDFGLFNRPGQNHTQAWYNTGQSGWGLAIESLSSGSPPADFEFFATYIFDSAGAPRWVVGDKPNAASAQLAMVDYKSQCPACAWFSSEQAEGRAAGSLTIQYSGSNTATLSTDIVLPAPLSGSWTRTALPIIPIADPVQ